MTSKLTKDSVPRLAPRVSVRRALGQLMISAGDGVLHALEHADGAVSEVGERIVELVDGRRSIWAIAQTVQAEFEVDFGLALADTLHFVQVLVEKKVVAL